MNTKTNIDSDNRVEHRRGVKRTLRKVLALALLAVLLTPPNTLHAADQKLHPFFPFCIDWHDAKKRNFAEQAAMLKELGYDGVGHIWLDGVAERIKTLDEAGLKLFHITMNVEVAPDKTPYDRQKFKDVLIHKWSARYEYKVSG